MIFGTSQTGVELVFFFNPHLQMKNIYLIIFSITLTVMLCNCTNQKIITLMQLVAGVSFGLAAFNMLKHKIT